MTVPAILLAAGASRRLGQPKQLLLHGGETLLRRSARLALEAGFRPLRVVLGAEVERCREALKGLDVEILFNPQWEAGMGWSIRTGMADLGREAEAVLLLVCDQTNLEIDLLNRIRACHEAHPDRILASRYAGVRGIPALFPRRCFDLLEALSGDRGARNLLQEGEVLEVPFPGGEQDVDSPSDLSGLLR